MENQNMNKQECMEKYEVLLQLLHQMQQEQSYLNRAMELLEKMPASGTPGDIAGQARAMAIGDAIKAKEQTNQGLLSVYVQMYTDLRKVLFPAETDAI